MSSYVRFYKPALIGKKYFQWFDIHLFKVSNPAQTSIWTPNLGVPTMVAWQEEKLEFECSYFKLDYLQKSTFTNSLFRWSQLRSSLKSGFPVRSFHGLGKSSKGVQREGWRAIASRWLVVLWLVGFWLVISDYTTSECVQRVQRVLLRNSASHPASCFQSKKCYLFAFSFRSEKKSRLDNRLNL